MEIKHSSVAGTLESSDVLVSIEPGKKPGLAFVTSLESIPASAKIKADAPAGMLPRLSRDSQSVRLC